MTTAALQKYFDDFAALDVEYSNVRKNEELSNVGKMRAFERIEEKRAALRVRVVEAFTKEYDRQRAAMEANNRARSKALESAVAGINQASIDLEAGRVSQMLKNGKSENELIRDWNENRYSSALVIGWKRAIESAPKRNDSLTALLADVRQEYEQVRNTPEVQKITSRGSELADAARELKQDTFQMMNLVSRGNAFDLSGAAVKLRNLAMRIVETPLQNGGVYVQFVPSPDEQLQALNRSDTFVIGG